MVLFTFAKQLGRAIIRRKASTTFVKPSSFGFNLYKAFSSAPVSTLRQFSTFGDGNQDKSSGDNTEPRAPQPAFNNPETDIFVGGLDWTAGENEIKDLFKESEGLIVRIPRNPDGRSRGFAFVRFPNAESAKKALAANGQVLLGRTIRVAAAGEKPPTKNNKIFVANINNSASQEELNQHFSKYGKIASTKLVHDPEGNPRGFGFIEFENSEDALKALKSSGEEFQGRNLVVNISLPKSKSMDRNDSRYGGNRDSFEGRRESYGGRRESRYDEGEDEDYGESRRGGYGRRGDDFDRDERRDRRGGDSYDDGSRRGGRRY